MADAGFIFALVVGATILVGMLIVAHISVAWLEAHRRERANAEAAAKEAIEPSLPIGGLMMQAPRSGKFSWYGGGGALVGKAIKRSERTS